MLGIIGAVGGVLGIISFLINFWDRFWPPSVEVLGIRPVIINSTEKLHLEKEQIEFKNRGFSVIAHLRSKNRAISVSSIEVIGKESLTGNNWLIYTAKDGKSLTELEKEYNKIKPYYLAAYTGYIEPSPGPIRMEPYEERYIIFTLIPQKESSSGIPIDWKYVGSESQGKKPVLKKTRADLSDFFNLRPSEDKKTLEPTSLRKEFTEGNMHFVIITGAKEVKVLYSQIKKPNRWVRAEQWNTTLPDQLFDKDEP